MIKQIEKRDGRCVFFDVTKIANAIYKAAETSGGHDYQMSMRLALDAADYIETHSPTETPTVEYVQDAVEKILIEQGHAKTAKAYILYRKERSRQREMNTGLMKIYEDLTFQSAVENDIKRENANIDGDTAMGTMLKYGSEGAKRFNEMFLLEPRIAKAHREGDIHIHDFDFYALTTTCCQIDLVSCASQTTFAVIRRSRALPFSPTRMTSTAVRAYRTLITAWRRVSKRHIGTTIATILPRHSRHLTLRRTV